ncbi:MAG: hypothetical protein IT428_26610 [Planctomycetaceae bacterium]|nr:hypothetical protein [Planctomycetaceae bacterium]
MSMFVVMTGLLLTSAGCGVDTAGPGKAPGAVAGGPPAVAGPKTYPVPPPDTSLSIDEYLKAGMPAPDREWHSVDMETADRILTSLTTTDYAALPRFQSSRSGAMFDRITSRDNLVLFKTDALPNELRVPTFLAYYKSHNEIYKRYLSGYIQKKVTVNELIELSGSTLRGSALLAELVNQFSPPLDKNDPNFATRSQGLTQAKRGLAITVGGALTMVSDTQNSPPSDRKRLLAALDETFPVILPELLEASQTEIVTRLRTMSQSPDLQELQPELGALAEKAKALTERKKPTP